MSDNKDKIIEELEKENKELREMSICKRCGFDNAKQLEVDPTLIKEYYKKTGKKVGFKPAGGISTVKDALCYLAIVDTILGKEWLTPELFRIGASRLANNLLSALEQKTVGYY